MKHQVFLLCQFSSSSDMISPAVHTFPRLMHICKNKNKKKVTKQKKTSKLDKDKKKRTRV